MTLTDGTCTLDGNYTLKWSKICSPNLGTTPCPINIENATVSYYLTSENFCAEISVEVGLIGTLSVFGDAGYTTAKTSFVVGTRAYFKLAIDSELNTPTKQVVTFSKTTLVSVTVKPSTASVPIRLYENKAASVFPDASTDPKVDIQVDNSLGTKTVGFNFLFTKQLATALAANSKLSFTVAAEAQATYTQSSKKRGILQANANENSEYSTSAEIDPQTNITDVSSGSMGSSVNAGSSAVKSSTKSTPSTSNSAVGILSSLVLIAIALMF